MLVLNDLEQVRNVVQRCRGILEGHRFLALLRCASSGLSYSVQRKSPLRAVQHRLRFSSFKHVAGVQWNDHSIATLVRSIRHSCSDQVRALGTVASNARCSGMGKFLVMYRYHSRKDHSRQHKNRRPQQPMYQSCQHDVSVSRSFLLLPCQHLVTTTG